MNTRIDHSRKYQLFYIVLTFSSFLLSSCSSLTRITPPASPKSITNSTPITTTAHFETLSSPRSNSTLIPSPLSIHPTPLSESVTPTQSKTPRPTQTPTPTSVSICPKADPALLFELPKNPSDLETSIMGYLSNGGELNNIKSLMESYEASPPSIFPIISVISEDLDMDSIKEIVISTHISPSHTSTISIFHCGHYNYYLMHSIIYSLDEAMFVDILLADRIFANKAPFLIIRENSPYGWAEIYRAIGWTGSEWRTIDLGSATSSEIALFDKYGGGIKEVFIRTNLGSRMMIEEYKYDWNSSQYKLVSTSFTPGNSRLDYFQYAETALSEGNPMLAISYYEIAARNEYFASYPSDTEMVNNMEEFAKPYQQSFAYFRLVALWYYLGRPDLAHHDLQEMTDNFPQKTPGNEFVLAATELASMYDKGSSFLDSCLKAVSFLDERFPNVVTDHLGGWMHVDFFIIQTSDICKVK